MGFQIGSVYIGYDWLGWIIVGGIAGWLAGQLMRGRSLGCLANVIVGIVGAIIGGWIFGQLGILRGNVGLFGSIVVATIGAAVLLFIVDLLNGNPRGRGRPRRY